jgi:NADPH:quinone reductase
MRNLLFKRCGEPADLLSLLNVDDLASPGSGEVLIRVTKRLIHLGDLSLVRGHFPGEVLRMGSGA